MNNYQANALKKLQVQLGVVKHEARNDLNFAQQLRAVGLFNCKLEFSALTIASVLENSTPEEIQEYRMEGASVNDIIHSKINQMANPYTR